MLTFSKQVNSKTFYSAILKLLPTGFTTGLYYQSECQRGGSTAVMIIYLIVCASVVSYLAFVLALFVPHLSCSCLSKALLRDFWHFLGIFTYILHLDQRTADTDFEFSRYTTYWHNRLVTFVVETAFM